MRPETYVKMYVGLGHSHAAHGTIGQVNRDVTLTFCGLSISGFKCLGEAHASQVVRTTTCPQCVKFLASSLHKGRTET